MLRDRFLQEITVGCVIAYPGRASSRCWITTGTVTEIIDGPPPADYPSWRRWPSKLRLDGGSQGAGGRQLGRRTITHNDDIIVVAKAEA